MRTTTLGQLLADSSISYRDLASVVGRSHETVRAWQQGRSTPSAADALQVLDTIGASATERLAVWAELLEVGPGDVARAVGCG